MSKALRKYNEKPANMLGQSARAIASSAHHAQTHIQLAYYAANLKGGFLQIEADMILEYELGLPPRPKKKGRSW